MIGPIFDALLSFFSQAVIIASSDIIMFAVPVLVCTMMAALYNGDSKGAKAFATEEFDVEVEDEVEVEVEVTRDLVLQAPQQGQKSALIQILCGLPTQVAAEVFAFTELGDVLSCAGLACQKLHNTIWRQPDFWLALGGPVFAESLRRTQRLDDWSCVLPMTACFRRWVFGLDGDWSLRVEELGSLGHPKDALRSVLEYAQVMRPGDAELSDVCRLVHAAVSAMQRADGQDDVLLGMASDVVACCLTRQDIFGSVDFKELNTSLASLEDRVEQAKLADERNHWFFSDDADSSEQVASHGTDEDSLHSLSSLAVIENHENQ